MAPNHDAHGRHDHDAHDHDAHDHGHDAHDHDAHGHDSHGHDSHGHDSHGHDSHGHDSHGHDSHGHDSHGHDSHGHDSHGHDAHGHDAHGHDSHGHDSHGHDAHGHDAHGHGHGHGGHDHSGHAHDLRSASKRSLIIALTLISSFMFVEVVGGILSGSLALLADAAHMLTDAAAIALALFAMWLSGRPASANTTFGFHRTEVLAALANTLSLWLIAGWIFYEAYNRFFEPPEIQGTLLFSVGIVGLLVNIVAAWVLHRAAEESLNVEGAFQHVMADLFGSVGVILSGGLIVLGPRFVPGFNWPIVDPILSILIALLILKVSWSLFMGVLRVLLEGTPDHVDIIRLCDRMEEIPGVTLVHDVHAWTITSGYNAFTAHVLIDDSVVSDRSQMLLQLRNIAKDSGLTHLTLQLEGSASDCQAENHHVEHLFVAADD